MTIHGIFIQVEPLNGKVWQITPHGWISAGQNDTVDHALSDQLAMGHKRLILDLSNVESISNEAVKLLVGVWQRARESKGNLVLVGLNPRIHEMLQLIGLDLVFPIVETQAQAIAQFGVKK